jgi:hypothetical protein
MSVCFGEPFLGSEELLKCRDHQGPRIGARYLPLLKRCEGYWKAGLDKQARRFGLT